MLAFFKRLMGLISRKACGSQETPAHEPANPAEESSARDRMNRLLTLMREAEEKAWWKDKTSAIAESDEQFAVIGPRADFTPGELKLLGQRLKDWQATNSDARHIWGLDDLLEGRHPRTPPVYLMVPYPTDHFAESYESVALIFVAKGTDHKQAAASLTQALGEICKRLAWFTDPMDYGNWNR